MGCCLLDYLNKTCTRDKKKPAKKGEGGTSQVPLHPRSYWQVITVGQQQVFSFFEGMATGRFPMLQLKALYPCTYWQHQLDLVAYKKLIQ